MSENLAQFLDYISRSGLISRPRLDRELQKHEMSGWSSRKEFAEHLVECGLLTEWQARNLLNRRYKGFFLGNFKILGFLRGNARVRVYVAENQRLKRRFAVKVLRRCHNTDWQELVSFHRSIRAMARMTHPNILQALDAQVDSAVNYVVVEHFEGETLESFVARAGQLDLELVIRLLLQMTLAVQHSHERGVILRGLDPATTLVDGCGRLKLDSFDWARLRNDDPLAASLEPSYQMAVECCHFLSPESVISSFDVSESADIYSLGCIFYLMLIGRPPFIGSTADVLCAHQRHQPPHVSEVRRDIPRKIGELCNAMMAKRPISRPPSRRIASEVAKWVTRN